MGDEKKVKTDCKTKEEDKVTERLADILKYAEYLRCDIISWLLDNKCDSNKIHTIKANDIHTQYNEAQVGIFDIFITNKKCKIIIENKIDVKRNLEESQKTEYINFLQSQKESCFNAIIFLIPNGYEHKKCLNSIKEANNICVSIKEWNDLLRYMELKEFGKGNSLLQTNIDYFCNHINNAKYALLHFTAQEALMLYKPNDLYTAVKTIEKITALTNKAKEKIIEKLNDKDLFSCGDDATLTSKENANANKSKNFGSYLNIKKDATQKYSVIFYGLSFNIADEKPEFVFNVDIKKGFVKKDTAGYEFDNWFYFPIDDKFMLENDKNSSELIESFAEQVSKIINENFSMPDTESDTNQTPHKEDIAHDTNGSN